MGNKQAKRVDELQEQERARLTKESDAVASYTNPERMDAKTQADALRQSIIGGYQQFANGANGTGGGGGGGGIADIALDPIYNELDPRYRALSGGLEKSMGGYQQFADTGGITDENASRIRGNGVFDEMAKTGGYSDLDRSNVRARGIAPVGAFYSNLKNQLARRNAVQGGFGVGYDSGSSRLARDASISGSAAARDTELGLSDSIRTGRMQGASALSGSEAQLASMINQGKLQGLGGLENLGRFGASGMQDVANARMQVAQHNASAAASRSAAGAADERYANQMKMAGLGGLMDVYGSTPAELARYDDNIYRNRALQAGIAVDQNRTQAQNIQPSGWDRAAQWGALAAGIGGAAFTGGASMALPSMVNKYQANRLAGMRQGGGVVGPFAGSPSYDY